MRSEKGRRCSGGCAVSRETSKRIEADAEEIMRACGVQAYAEARRREREAKTREEAKNWSRVASAIAQKTSKRVGLDDATMMAADANLAASFEPFVSTPSATVPEDRPAGRTGQIDL